MHTLRFVTRERRERSQIERTDAALEGLVTAVESERTSERASDGEIVGEICLMFLSRTNPRLYTGVLQRGLREDLLAHQRKRQARGVPVPPRQVAAKRFRRQSGMTSTSDLDPISIYYQRNEID